MKKHGLFILFVIILAGTAGMIIKEKYTNERSVIECASEGKTWNYMEGKCDISVRSEIHTLN